MRIRRDVHPLVSSMSFWGILMSRIRLLRGQNPPTVSEQSNAPSNVPDYITKYAPLVYLHPQEPYLPSDIGAQITNTKPKLEFADVPGLPSPLTLDNLDELNKFGKQGTNIYLTSNDDITKNPAWIKGVRPGPDGGTGDAKACAIIVADKGNGLVDAFYMYFYAFDYSGIVQVINQNLGNHVGDWEHTMVRFRNGKPESVWYSQHSGGQAFKYEVLEKDTSGRRPMVYSANGTHANFATNGPDGKHERSLDGVSSVGLLNDYTGNGALWDPIKSAYWYKWSAPGPPPDGTNYPPTRDVASLGYLTAYDAATSPVGWFYFAGRWGDFRYKKDDPRQKNFLGAVWKYDSGPEGPAFKKLGRADVWPGDKGEILGKLMP